MAKKLNQILVCLQILLIAVHFLKEGIELVLVVLSIDIS